MARFPGAKIKLVARYRPGGSAGGDMPHCGRLILHTAVSPASSLFDLFNTPGRAVAHFYVAADGTVEQYVDTGRRASAVLNGNHDAITVETQDMGGPFPRWSGSNVPKWTDAQVKALAELAVWCHRRHGIPLHRLLNSRPGRKGIGWHRLGIDGNFPSGLLGGRVAGGELWSSSAGKACPGDKRIRQVVDEVIPLARHLAEGDVAGPTSSAKGGDHVEAALKEIRASIRNTRPGSPLRKSLRAVARQLRKILSRKKG